VETVRLSPKYQVVIPKRARRELGLLPGQELQVYVLDGSIRFRKLRPITELRGMAKGITWEDGDRDRTERF